MAEEDENDISSEIVDVHDAAEAMTEYLLEVPRNPVHALHHPLVDTHPPALRTTGLHGAPRRNDRHYFNHRRNSSTGVGTKVGRSGRSSGYGGRASCDDRAVQVGAGAWAEFELDSVRWY